MLNVSNENLVVEEKAIYSVEKFLIARRFMYWQVYLHKTGIVAEQLLIRVLKRAKEVMDESVLASCSLALKFFMDNKVERADFNEDVLKTFAQLDDIDILAAIKSWQNHSDFVLARLSQMLLNRRLLKVKLKNKPIDQNKLLKYRDNCKSTFGINDQDAEYFVFSGKIENKAYDQEKQHINILKKNGKLIDVAKASDQLNLKALSKTVTKYYICFPKESV